MPIDKIISKLSLYHTILCYLNKHTALIKVSKYTKCPEFFKVTLVSQIHLGKFKSLSKKTAKLF